MIIKKSAGEQSGGFFMRRDKIFNHHDLVNHY